MTINRLTGVLAALTLMLAACSTPADLNDSANLSAQFGSEYDDIGIDVAVTSTGSIAVLSTQQGFETGTDYTYDEYGEYYEYEYEYPFTNIEWQLYDKSGSLAWANTVSSDDCSYEYESGYDCKTPTAQKLVADTKGNTYALYTSFYSYGSDHETDYYLKKLNSSGNEVNNFYLGGFSRSYFDAGVADVAVDGAGNFVVIVRQNVSGTIRDVVKKYNSSGSLQWQRISPVGTPYGVTITSGGTVHVSGSTGLARISSANSLVWTKTGGSYPVKAGSSITASGTNFYVRNLKDIRKYDQNGKLLWLKTQTGLNNPIPQDIVADASGNVYMSGKYDAGSGNYSPFARKLNSSGTVLWTKTFGTSAYDDARGVATVSGTDIFLTGETQGSLAHANYGGPSNRDGYVRRINSSGNPLWTR